MKRYRVFICFSLHPGSGHSWFRHEQDATTAQEALEGALGAVGVDAVVLKGEVFGPASGESFRIEPAARWRVEPE